MILVTACFSIESRWIARRPDVRVVRTAIGERSRETLDGLGSKTSDASLLIAVGFCRVVLDAVGTDLPLSAGRPFWTSALHHPVVAARAARDAIAAGRVLGTAVDALIDTFAGRSDA